MVRDRGRNKIISESDIRNILLNYDNNIFVSKNKIIYQAKLLKLKYLLIGAISSSFMISIVIILLQIK